jgi:hypothetical protein
MMQDQELVIVTHRREEDSDVRVDGHRDEADAVLVAPDDQPGQLVEPKSQFLATRT